MNLVSDPWIPVVMLDKTPRLVSLNEVFRDGETIADLAANPCQRIALMRLLICIAQAALDGPKDEEDWLACRSRLADAALAYLDTWQHRFNLFGEHAFLQVDGLYYPDDSFIKPLETLDATSANGGTGLTMLWDHDADSTHPLLAEHSIPLLLLCYMNFSCSGKVGKAQWRDNLFNESTAVAPSHNYLHTYLLGNTLLETIHFNLISKNTVATSVTPGDPLKWGSPVWEHMPTSPEDTEAIRNASESYLGRLVPLSRLVALIQTDSRVDCMAGPPPDGLRMKRLPFLREPAASVLLSKKDGQPFYLSAKAGRHIWRDLEAILATERQNGTLSLQSFLQAFVYTQRITNFRVWIGGSVKGDNEAKYDDLVEWNADLPSACFLDRSLTAYRTGITSANIAETSLSDAIRKYSKPDKNKPGIDTKQIPFEWAKTIYWNSLDISLNVLLTAVEKNTLEAFKAWKNKINAALYAAYERTCPHETPRQIQAYAQGLKILDSWKEK